LERILRNLIGNAIKYTPSIVAGAAGRVVVECEKRGEFIAIIVGDNGIGIPKDKHDDIFKEYVQIGNPERDREKGFGLGLSIVRHLGRLLKHEVKLEESAEGRGSRFSVLVRRAASIPPELRPSKVSKRTSEIPNFKDTVVVLIEDDTASREALYELLLDWGCYVVEAESAADAISKIRSEESPLAPNFILSDYRLREGRTGLDAISAVRQEIKSPVPAAIWSAETSPQVLQCIAEAGIEMLSKPVDEMQLLKVLKRDCPRSNRVPSGAEAS
jgi:CheY-like chemotaxis protein